MSKPTQADLARQLRAAKDSGQQRDLALALLEATRSRDKTDLALRVLVREEVCALLEHAHRPLLRAKAITYFEDDKRDRGGNLRAQIMQLLTSIGHPADLDLYLRGVRVYQRYPPPDSAQHCRAAALLGILNVDPDRGSAYAAHLLGEPDTSVPNGQPSLAAINVLAHTGQLLPVYQFVRLQGEAFIQRHNPELVARAFEVLADGFPDELYAELADEYVTKDVPVVTSGIVDAIVEGRMAELYPLLERVITGTRHTDVQRYALIAVAAAREEPLTDLIYRLADLATAEQAMNFIEAVELTTDSRKPDTIARLERKL